MSLRGDEVRIAAGKKLYELYDELAPTPYRHQTTLLRFLPHLFNSVELTKTKESKQDCLAPLKIQKRFHKVAKGETLWTISSHNKISVKRIVEALFFNIMYLNFFSCGSGGIGRRATLRW